MNYLVVLGWYFFIGVLIQATVIYLTRSKKPPWEWLVFSIILSFSALLPDKDESVYKLFRHIMLMGYLLSFFVSFSLIIEKLIPKINEKTVLEYNIVLIYVIFSYFANSEFFLLILGLIALPTFLTFFNSFNKRSLNKFWQTAIYIWFLTISFVILALQLNFNIIFSLFSGNVFAYRVSIFIALIYGMAVMSLAQNGMAILYLIPIPGKRQTFKERLKEVKEYIKDICHVYQDDQLKRNAGLLIIVLQGGILALNYFFNFLPHFLMINLSLIISPWLMNLVFQARKT